MAHARLDDKLLDQLVVDARAGSGPAFGRLWELLSPVVAGYVRGRGVRDVDDVTSEVFLAAFRGIGRFVGGGADFRRWLFTIAHHRAVDETRRAVRQTVEIPYQPGEDRREAPSAEAAALDRMAYGDALSRLDLLPDDQRDVLLLRVVADLPVDQVAGILERSPEAVRQLQHRALARLRRELAGETLPRPVTPSAVSAIAESR